MRYIKLIVLLALAQTLVMAQTGYSLADCEQMAIKNNYKIKNSRLDMEAASQTKKEAFTKYFPSIQASGTYFNSSKDLLSMDIEAPGLLPVPLPLSLLKDGTMGGVLATQPVFMGGRIVNSNKLAKVGKEVSELQMQLTEDEVLMKTNEYFWAIANLEEKLQTISIVENLLTNLQKDVDMAVKAGVTTRNDLLRVELQMQEVQSNRLKIENGLKVSKMLLAQFIGTEIKDFTIQYNIEDKYQNPQVYYQNPYEAVLNRSETKLLEQNVNAAKLKTKISTGEHLPSVAVGGGYLHNGLLDDAINTGVIYAGVSVPISDWWGGTHSRKRYKAMEKIAENERANAVELMTIEIMNTWNEVTEAYEQLLLAEKSIQSATENLRIVNNSYQAGTISLSDLLDAQVLYQQSKNLHSDAFSQYQVKLLKHKLITNS